MWQQGHRRDAGINGNGSEKKDGTAFLVRVNDLKKFPGRENKRDQEPWGLEKDGCWVGWTGTGKLDPDKGVREIFHNSKRSPQPRKADRGRPEHSRFLHGQLGIVDEDPGSRISEGV